MLQRMYESKSYGFSFIDENLSQESNELGSYACCKDLTICRLFELYKELNICTICIFIGDFNAQTKVAQCDDASLSRISCRN